MAVTLRPYLSRDKDKLGQADGWEYDIRLKRPDGTVYYREKRKSPCATFEQTRNWAVRREKQFIRDEISERQSPPTFNAFWPRFLMDHAKAEKHKASGIDSKESNYRLYLKPVIGNKRLNQIGKAEEQTIKGAMKALSPKTVNNALTTMNKALKCAVEWEVLDRLPLRIKFLKVEAPRVEFYDFEQYDALVDAASKCGERQLITVLLAGDAGLRAGEILALEWADLDFKRSLIHVQRAEWKRKVGKPKGGRSRIVEMTAPLAQALQEHRHLRGPRVLYRENGERVSEQTTRTWVAAAEKRAGLRESGRGGRRHILRHTFCSHLAMLGRTIIEIKELAGHVDIRTTQRYMHLSPNRKAAAVKALDERRKKRRGDSVEIEG